MILTKKQILKEIKGGNLKIKPFAIKNVGAASYDVTLSNEIRVFREKVSEIDIRKIEKDVNFLKKITKTVKIKDYFLLKPGALVWGITKEKITLPEDVAGWIQGRSRFARIGLMVHVSASLIHPGSSNKQVLEIFNASRNSIKLKPGVRIAQVIFEKCEGSSQYKGEFFHQMKI